MYDGQTCQLNEGCPSLIKSGSSDELTIADWMEQELGFRNTIIMVIENWLDKDKVNNEYQKRMQGSKYNTNWENFRSKQCKQYMIMTGRITKKWATYFIISWPNPRNVWFSSTSKNWSPIRWCGLMKCALNREVVPECIITTKSVSPVMNTANNVFPHQW